jgi:hypothetical protein
MAGIQSPHVDSPEDEKVQCRRSVQVGFALQSMFYCTLPCLYYCLHSVFFSLFKWDSFIAIHQPMLLLISTGDAIGAGLVINEKS